MTTALERITAGGRHSWWRRLIRSGGLPPQVGRWLRRRMPRRLFPRSLLIIVLPMIALQSVVAFVFMDRHWGDVTRRLSEATASEIAATVELLERSDSPAETAAILDIARSEFFTDVRLLPGTHLPPPEPKPFFALLDRTLSRDISEKVGKPFWIDTVGRSSFIEVRIKLADEIVQIVARRSQTYASNSHITLVWMAGSSLVLMALAVLVLHNQVRPIKQLARAAERFGRGRPVDTYRPYGALEVRQAGWAFIEMKHRIERQIEQRTAMLAGVSHDLRTILTRFRLELAMLEDSPETEALRHDVDAMQTMLEEYLQFAKTESDEHSDAVDLKGLIEEVASEAERRGARVSVAWTGEPIVSVKPNAFRRMLSNIVVNACNYATAVRIEGRNVTGWTTVTVDDDGPGIPAAEREEAFRPFHRIGIARNQDVAGTGLGLTIARDIARGHGGDVRLTDSPLGGLRVEVRIPR